MGCGIAILSDWRLCGMLSQVRLRSGSRLGRTRQLRAFALLPLGIHDTRQAVSRCKPRLGRSSRRRGDSRPTPVPPRSQWAKPARGIGADCRTRARCGPDVISTATVKGAREGARVEIMSVGCPQTAGRASMSGQCPDIARLWLPDRSRCRRQAGKNWG